MEEGLLRQWTHRPLFACATAFCLGVAARFEPVLFLLLLLLIPLLVATTSRWWTVVGLGLGLWLAPIAPLPIIFQKRPFHGTITVTSVPRTGKKGEIMLAKADKLVYELTVPADRQVSQWDELEVTGEIRPIEPYRREQLTRKGVSGRLVLYSIDQVIHEGLSLSRVGGQVRLSFRDYANSTLPAENAALIRSLCFNDDQDLPSSVVQNLKDSGTIHIISTSGLHVALLSALIFAIFQRLPIPRWAQVSLLALILLVYVSAAGWHPPAVRSLILIVGGLSAYLFKRQADVISLLSLGFLYTVLMSPQMVLDAGLQLSYAALFGLTMFARWPRTPSWKARSMAAVRGTFAVSLMTIPLTGFWFGQFSLTGFLANPLIEFVMPVTVGASLLSWVIQPLGGFLMPSLVDPLANYITWVADVFASPEWSVVQVPTFSGYWLLVFYGLVILLWNPKLRQKDD